MSLISPLMLAHQFPVSRQFANNIAHARDTARKIINGQDERLLVIAGPCSIHDIKAGKEFADLMQKAALDFADDLFIIMRVYFEKPRTTMGWRGLISDPFLDGSYNINLGLKLAREFLVQLAKLNVPAATEFLDPILPQYLSDLITWNAVGARTAESQLHREIASGLPTPVGFKNTTDGNIKIAVDAANTARFPHHYLSIDENGNSAIISTKGNDCCHIILRGGNNEPNHSTLHVKQALQLLKDVHLPERLIIDCSHGNSRKNFQNQIQVAQSIAVQMEAGVGGIFGVMLESHLRAGNQKLAKNKILTYGQSITDECISWDDTLHLFNRLALANHKRKRIKHHGQSENTKIRK